MIKYKKSFYIETTDSISLNNENYGRLLFATRTGTLLFLNDDSYKSFINNSLELLPKETFISLLQAEAIVPENQNELEFVLNQNKEAISNSDTLSIVIQPGASCQLGCHYCGQQHTKQYMSDEIQIKLIQRIKRKIFESSCKNLSLTWYGAEPLMALNHIYNISRELIVICDNLDINYRASMVTNGLSLKNDIFKRLNEECKISTFQITIDGIDKYHDLNRYTKKEKGPTFTIIFNNLLSIVNDFDYKDRNINMLIRSNVDKNNVDGLDEFINLLDKEKLQDKISFYLIPIHNWGDNDIENINGVEKNDFSVLEIDWLIKLIKLGFDTDILPNRSKVVCSAVKNHSEVYDAYGNVSTCWEVPYTPIFAKTDFEIGHLDNNFDEDIKKTPLKNWNNDIINDTSKSPCKKCNLLPVCGGSCPIHWATDTNACPSFKYNMKDRMLLEFMHSKDLIN
ncbi:radical SAM/SPASM domain-containing protein [Siphonobacter sp. SORGH_AS_1065]|uniref:radical SAM/SPASM domain-containing protein n=1 Tax=Siphonobacter sp. SORGH_AS_1065 TaxID=3041795 RepID=UPI0027D90795|nr:radical SAM protein [Siphonobacter sp. SORGH_AS_1065]